MSASLVMWEGSLPPVPAAAAWWRAEGLPEPEPAPNRRWWASMEASGETVGVVGVELYGRTALLRSLVVEPSHRRQGQGEALVWTALGHLRTHGVEEVFLLTETAAAFFAGWGFAPVARDQVPAELTASDELRGACPETATVMRLALTRPALRVRPARLDDAPAVATIYNQGIQDRVATFETEERDAEERRRWLQDRDPRYGVLVAEDGAALVGWLSLNPFSARPAYRFVADISIYVERSARGRGVGGRLLAAGLPWAQARGFHKLVLTMFPENRAARQLYLGHGFRPVGILREQGRLDGVWRDTEVMERLLDDGPEASAGQPT